MGLHHERCILTCYGESTSPLILIAVCGRYRDRFWRESTFDGIELVQGALEEAYGKGEVNLVQATFRWLNHHSQMKGEGV